MQLDAMLQCTVQGCGGRQGALLQVDILCRTGSLNILFIVQLKGFAGKQKKVFKLLSDTLIALAFFR